MRYLRRATISIIVPALLLAACGGGDGSVTAETTATDPSSSSPATTSATSGGPTVTGPTTSVAATPTVTAKPPADSGNAGDAFCAKGAKVSDEVDAATSQLGTSPADMKLQYEALISLFAELTKVAPAAIKADFAVVTEGFTKFAATLAKYNYDFTKIIGDPDAMKSLEQLTSGQFAQASANIEAWVSKNCADVPTK